MREINHLSLHQWLRSAIPPFSKVLVFVFPPPSFSFETRCSSWQVLEIEGLHWKWIFSAASAVSSAVSCSDLCHCWCPPTPQTFASCALSRAKLAKLQIQAHDHNPLPQLHPFRANCLLDHLQKESQGPTGCCRSRASSCTVVWAGQVGLTAGKAE